MIDPSVDPMGRVILRGILRGILLMFGKIGRSESDLETAIPI
jgi:hypothetical protein